MPLPTCDVTVRCYTEDGQPDPGAIVTARLNHAEVYQGYVIPEEQEAVADATGAAVLTLFRNALGSTGSAYKVRITGTGGAVVKVTVVVPDQATAFLEDIAMLPPYPGKPDGARAIEIALAEVENVRAAATAAALGEHPAEFSVADGAICNIDGTVTAIAKVFLDGRYLRPIDPSTGLTNYTLAGNTVTLTCSLVGFRDIDIFYIGTPN